MLIYGQPLTAAFALRHDLTVNAKLSSGLFDIGGMRAGSLSPDCEEIFQEGIIVPPVRVRPAHPGA